MRKIILFLTFLCLLSCNDYNANVSKEDIVRARYNKEFIGEFGSIDPTHTWGFEDLSTRSVDVNSNEWAIRPNDITPSEKAEVIEWFSTHLNPQSESVDWSEFFIQQVYRGHDNMDYLFTSLDGETDYDHVNNFNNAEGSIQWMKNSTSAYFGYHNSMDSKFHFKFTILNINGSYYVGFDFEATGQNPNQKESANGYYNDWIVKITPCLPKDNKGRRIFAEDMGYIGDWDFNDVVLDVVFYTNKQTIILQAAGGTIPLYVNGKEVHELFKVPPTQIVNTWNNITKAPVIWTETAANTDYNNIHIRTDRGEILSYKGTPPGKFAVPSFIEWTEENEKFSDKYPLFPDWVTNKNKLFY